jgi:hypothetical protein
VRDTCSRSCTNDSQCDSGFVCTNYLPVNMCVRACTTDDQCPASPSTQPTTAPWYRLACNTSTGKCVP